jgi:hypothetical protein
MCSMYQVVPARDQLQLHFSKFLAKDMHDRGPNGMLQGKPPGFPCPIRVRLSFVCCDCTNQEQWDTLFAVSPRPIERLDRDLLS